MHLSNTTTCCVPSGSSDGSIHHHDVRIADHLTTVLSAHSQGVCGLSWSDDGKLLASGGNDNIVNIWKADATTGFEPHRSMTNHQAAVKVEQIETNSVRIVMTDACYSRLFLGVRGRTVCWPRVVAQLTDPFDYGMPTLVSVWHRQTLSRK